MVCLRCIILRKRVSHSTGDLGRNIGRRGGGEGRDARGVLRQLWRFVCSAPLRCSSVAGVVCLIVPGCIHKLI